MKVWGNGGSAYTPCRTGELSHVEYVRVRSSVGKLSKISVARYCLLCQFLELEFQEPGTNFYKLRQLIGIIALSLVYSDWFHSCLPSGLVSSSLGLGRLLGRLLNQGS